MTGQAQQLAPSWRDHDNARSHFIASSDEEGLHLHLRARNDDPAWAPVLFVHGATYASRLYDIPHEGSKEGSASWLHATAQAGFAAYGLDIRGYGLSRPAARPDHEKPYARAESAVRDIADAADWICAHHGVDRLRLVGGSWGSITAALYASTIGAGRVERLVLYAPIFAEKNPGWLSLLADPADPGKFNPAFGAFRTIDLEQTRQRWDEELPPGANWRDDTVLDALFAASASDDPRAAARNPAAFECPNGALADLWEVFYHCRPLHDPSCIHCPTMLIRGGADATSTRSDAFALFDRLAAQNKRYVEIAKGGHFLSAERRRGQLFFAVNGFLGEQQGREH